MKKVAINVCFGGFGLSPKAVRRLAELNDRECYFYVNPRNPVDFDKHILVSDEEVKNDLFWHAYDVPNIDEVLPKPFRDEDGTYKTYNALYSKHALECGRVLERHDQKLIQVIEELGKEANGRCSDLRIVEIPDDVEYEIDEYDGNEHIAEVHRTWR